MMRQRLAILLSFFPLILCSLWLSACQTTTPQLAYGLQPAYEGFIPARIAVLPCLPWPHRARFAALPLNNMGQEINSKLCQGLDAYVLKGFAGQPFMKGFTPSLVEKLLSQGKKADHLGQLPSLWRHDPEACRDCANAPSVYHYSIAGEQAWRKWLQDLSEMTRFSDAVLVPFVLFARERQFNDRGLLIAERSAGVGMFLIDSNNGKLLWCGERKAVLASQQFANEAKGTYPAYPAWEAIEMRLYTEDLWKEFPGKQWY